MPPLRDQDGASPRLVAELHRGVAAARPSWLAELRRALTAWATEVGLDSRCTQAVVLSTHEAAANGMEHAYPQEPGELAVRARCRSNPARIEVTVTDHGRWQEPDTKPGDRGRGLPLIRSLADHTDVRPGSEGTVVTMTWMLL
jgi:serine/threonine-protein kinase RsbW